MLRLTLRAKSHRLRVFKAQQSRLYLTATTPLPGRVLHESQGRGDLLAVTASLATVMGIKFSQCEELVDEHEGWDYLPLEEVRKHTTADSLWVTYQGGVYDVSKFVGIHPGGSHLILSAGGLDLKPFWDTYLVHLVKGNGTALPWLESHQIGRLSKEDQAIAEAEPAASVHKKGIAAGNRVAVYGGLRLLGVMALTPLLSLLQKLMRFLGRILPRGVVRSVSNYGWFPVSVPGFGAGASPMDGIKADGTRTKVAVVGGGISGMACAYTLSESGYEVTVYEARAQLGGNARVFNWDVNGKAVSTDTTVLYWAKEYYKNYTALLDRLGVTPAEFYCPFVVHSTLGGTSEYATIMPIDGVDTLRPSLRDRLAKDFKRWGELVEIVRGFNTMVTWDSKPSFYKHTGWLMYFNPMNFITMKSLCYWGGISSDFWEAVIVPVEASNMSCATVDDFSAVGMPVLEDLSPLNGTKLTSTWGKHNSREVFGKLSQACAEVKTSTRIMLAEYDPSQRIHTLRDDQGGEGTYDRVVFACPASAAANILGDGLGWVEGALLRGLRYHDDDERGFMRATLHTDKSTIPAGAHQEDILRDACFVCDVTREKDGQIVTEFIHNMAAWPPAQQQMTAEEKASLPPLLVSHNVHSEKTIDPSKILKEDDYARSHPRFSFRNLIITQLIPLIQGRRGVYYASNYAVAGNGHDLSCLSGMVCAEAIGAEYLFPENPDAKLDFDRLKGSMGCDHKAPSFDWLFPVTALLGVGGYIWRAQN